MYLMNTVLSLILLVSEMLKIPRAKVQAHLLQKLDFVTNKCDAFINAKKINVTFYKPRASKSAEYAAPLDAIKCNLEE